MADRNDELAEKREHWRAMCERQAESGISIARFCREEGIAAWKFRYWRRRLAEPEPGCGGPVFRELRIDGSGGADTPIEVELPGGAVVRLRAGFDEEALRRAARVFGGEARPC